MVQSMQRSDVRQKNQDTGRLETDLPLFAQPTPTSVEAAVANKPNRITQRQALLEWLQVRGDYGATDEEMQSFMEANTQRPRRVELWRLGLIRKKATTRMTLSKRRATVWVAI
jgi:protein involved in temperature-dependent protein secretion